MHEIIKQTLFFFIKNELESFTKSPVCSELYQLANKLGYQIQCSYGYGDDKKSIYLSFIVIDNNGEGVSAGEYDEYVHLNDAARIIEIDKKERIKFSLWEEDKDFIDSINWASKELKKKL